MPQKWPKPPPKGSMARSMQGRSVAAMVAGASRVGVSSQKRAPAVGNQAPCEVPWPWISRVGSSPSRALRWRVTRM